MQTNYVFTRAFSELIGASCRSLLAGDLFVVRRSIIACKQAPTVARSRVGPSGRANDCNVLRYKSQASSTNPL